MGVGFGGNAVFNRASPSSHPGCVGRIVADYVLTAPRHPARILDIGGTAAGFRARAALPAGCQVVIANPEADVGADFAYVADIPPTEPGFDLAMLFGVMMYLEREPLLSLLRDVRQRLRAPGTLLVAEPDPGGVIGGVEVAAKKVYAAIRSLWNPTRFTFHGKAEAEEMLRQAGFVRVVDRGDLTPNAMGVLPPPLPKYFVLAASI
jgi:SAM-dependent methyltransferase